MRVISILISTSFSNLGCTLMRVILWRAEQGQTITWCAEKEIQIHYKNISQVFHIDKYYWQQYALDHPV